MPGDLFFAIRGDRFDGHAFVAEALRAGSGRRGVSDAAPDSATGLAGDAADRGRPTRSRRCSGWPATCGASPARRLWR